MMPTKEEIYEHRIKTLESELEMYKNILAGVTEIMANDRKDKELEKEKERVFRHIVLSQEDLSPEYQQFVSEHFWELI